MPGYKLIAVKEKDVFQKRKAFHDKKVLQLVYWGWYERILRYLNTKGKVVEIGSGFGDFKRACRDCITSDVTLNPWVDVLFDGEHLPFKDCSLANIVGIDVLHHLRGLDQFFREANRVLIPGGRIVLVDMYMSRLSYWISRFIHFEDIKMSKIATDLFLNNTYADKDWGSYFKLIHREMHDFLAYPLSGGFNYPGLLFLQAAYWCLKLEKRLGFLKRCAAFKLTVVLEKNGTELWLIKGCR